MNHNKRNIMLTLLFYKPTGLLGEKTTEKV